MVHATIVRDGGGHESQVSWSTNLWSLGMSMQTATGFRLVGPAESVSGVSVAGAGDVNGDSMDDLIVGAPGAYPGGKSYVVFGTNTGFAASVELSELDGSNGFRLDGNDAYDSSGRSVAGAGDINGDGTDDLIIGTSRYEPYGQDRSAKSYVVFGTNAGFAASLDLLALDGSNGFRLDGIDASGYSVAGAGDVNGDDLDDLIIGAWGADPGARNNAGESDVLFGRDTGFAASLDLAAFDGSNGFRLEGIDAYDASGWSVAGAGDVNGDGIDDLIIGAPHFDQDGRKFAGESYVVFGSDTGIGPSLDLARLDGSNGFRLNGINASDYSGFSVAGAGDVNGDGIDDLIIGALGADPGARNSAGESYVVFGANRFAASVDLAALDGLNGFRLDGVAVDDKSGSAVAGAGDVNGDGFDDMIVSASLAAPDGKLLAGESYLVFGSDTRIAPSLDLATLDGSNGYRLAGIDAYDTSGVSIAGAGDFNGDGFDDLIIGASDADSGTSTTAGESYVVFGGADCLAALDWLSGIDGVIELADIGALVGTDAREAMSGTSADDTLCGLGGADTLLGQLGSDILRGGTGWDSLNGGGNWDELYGGWGNDRLDGRLGRDLLQGQRGSDILLAGGGDDTLVGGLGADALTGGAGNDVFVFRSGFESSGADRDILKADTAALAFDAPGAAFGDVIDLTLVDADATASGDQAFVWSGQRPGGRGTLWLSNEGALTVVRGNIDNDAPAELTIAIEDGSVLASAYTENDFLV